LNSSPLITSPWKEIHEAASRGFQTTNLHSSTLMKNEYSISEDECQLVFPKDDDGKSGTCRSLDEGSRSRTNRVVTVSSAVRLLVQGRPRIVANTACFLNGILSQLIKFLMAFGNLDKGNSAKLASDLRSPCVW